MGYKIHTRQHRWWGNWADDSPVARHLFDNQEEYEKVKNMSREDRTRYMENLMASCRYAIEVPGQKYEVGLIPCQEGFKLAFDNFIGNLDFTPLIREYTIEATLQEAHRHGHVATLNRYEDGTTQIHVHLGE